MGQVRRLDGVVNGIQTPSNQSVGTLEFRHFWNGRAGKRGTIPDQIAPILERLGVIGEGWVETVRQFGRRFMTAAGRRESLAALAVRRGKASDLLICGILRWGRVRAVGLTGNRVDKSQVRARIHELGRIKLYQQMRNCSVGTWVRHRMNLHTQKTLAQIR